jgi:hypothetical protein
MRQSQSRFRYCYERELLKSPALAGTITLRFHLDGQGIVTRASVAKTTMNNGRVESCVIKQLRSLHFPAPSSGSADISYPLVFQTSP